MPGEETHTGHDLLTNSGRDTPSIRDQNNLGSRVSTCALQDLSVTLLAHYVVSSHKNDLYDIPPHAPGSSLAEGAAAHMHDTTPIKRGSTVRWNVRHS